VRPSRLLLFTTTLLLTASACTGNHEPPAPSPRTLTIVSVLPRQGRNKARTDAMVKAMRAAIEARGSSVGAFHIRYVDADSADPEFGDESGDVCTALANQFAKSPDIVAVIGPQQPLCNSILVRSLNDSGLMVVGVKVDVPGVTHEVPGSWTDQSCFECSPKGFYPTGVRNYARVVPTEDSEGVAAVDFLASSGVRSAYILTIGDAFSTAYLAAGFKAESASRGLKIVGEGTYNMGAKSFAQDAERAIALHPDAIYLLAPVYNRGAELLRSLREGGFDGVIMSSLSIVDDSLLSGAGKDAEGAFFSSTRQPLAALPQAAEDLVDSIGIRDYAVDAVYASEAANLVLDAIGASDGSRVGVRDGVFQTSRAGLLGPISIDANGDVEPQQIAIFKASGAQFSYVQTIALPAPP
jgi:branched-chain amino acid transport system substrate-binding protein